MRVLDIFALIVFTGAAGGGYRYLDITRHDARQRNHPQSEAINIL